MLSRQNLFEDEEPRGDARHGANLGVQLHHKVHNALPVFDVLLHRLGARVWRVVIEIRDFVKLGVEFRHIRRAPRGDLGVVFLLDDGGRHLGNWWRVVELAEASERGSRDCDLP